MFDRFGRVGASAAWYNMGMGGDVKIVGRAIPMPFGEYELGVKGNASADGELVYEMDELPIQEEKFF